MTVAGNYAAVMCTASTGPTRIVPAQANIVAAYD